MKLSDKQVKSLAKLIEYNFENEVTHFEEEYDVDTSEMSNQDIIDLCEAEDYTDHILYHILILSAGE